MAVRTQSADGGQGRGSRRLELHLAGSVAALLIGAGLSTGAAAQPAPMPDPELAVTEEYRLKAAHLVNLGKFVAWPDGATDAAPFALCVFGQDPFGPALGRAAAEGLVHDRPVAVRQLDDPADARACRVLFVAASEDDRLAPLLEALEAAPVLTVGDAPGFVERGGMIELSIEAARVVFSVNLGASEEAGLSLSSELLRLAAAVVRPSGP